MGKIGLAEFAVTACYVIIFTFAWRAVAAANADKPLGQAMANVIY